MSNESVRKYAKEKGVFLWEVAKAIGISEPTMTRRMRSELPEQEQLNMIGIIDTLAKQKNAV